MSFDGLIESAKGKTKRFCSVEGCSEPGAGSVRVQLVEFMPERTKSGQSKHKQTAYGSRNFCEKHCVEIFNKAYRLLHPEVD